MRRTILLSLATSGFFLVLSVVSFIISDDFSEHKSETFAEIARIVQP